MRSHGPVEKRPRRSPVAVFERMIEADPEVKRDRADHRVQEAFGLVGRIGEVAKVPKAI